MRWIIALIFLYHSAFYAQRATFLTRSELGFMVGGSSYIGDLNAFNPFYRPNLAFGGLYRFTVHSRVCIRANVFWGSVEAYDSDSKNELQSNRNLSFQSKIMEGAAGVEFHYAKYQMGNKKYWGTGYLLAEIGLFRMNPMAEYDGEMYELQPLGTEGQGTSFSPKEPYNLTQLCIPLGVGFKATLGKRAAFCLEMGLRKTFTDYLDDVGSDSYVDPFALAQENGPYAAVLSNRSIDDSRFGRRGVSATKDWYLFYGGMLTFKLGKARGCYFKN
jgi:hypothetical protein